MTDLLVDAAIRASLAFAPVGDVNATTSDAVLGSLVHTTTARHLDSLSSGSPPDTAARLDGWNLPFTVGVAETALDDMAQVVLMGVLGCIAVVLSSTTRRIDAPAAFYALFYASSMYAGVASFPHMDTGANAQNNEGVSMTLVRVASVGLVVFACHAFARRRDARWPTILAALLPLAGGGVLGASFASESTGTLSSVLVGTILLALGLAERVAHLSLPLDRSSSADRRSGTDDGGDLFSTSHLFIVRPANGNCPDGEDPLCRQDPENVGSLQKSAGSAVVTLTDLPLPGNPDDAVCSMTLKEMGLGMVCVLAAGFLGGATALYTPPFALFLGRTATDRFAETRQRNRASIACLGTIGCAVQLTAIAGVDGPNATRAVVECIGVAAGALLGILFVRHAACFSHLPPMVRRLLRRTLTTFVWIAALFVLLMATVGTHVGAAPGTSLSIAGAAICLSTLRCCFPRVSTPDSCRL